MKAWGKGSKASQEAFREQRDWPSAMDQGGFLTNGVTRWHPDDDSPGGYICKCGYAHWGIFPGRCNDCGAPHPSRPYPDSRRAMLARSRTVKAPISVGELCFIYRVIEQSVRASQGPSTEASGGAHAW